MILRSLNWLALLLAALALLSVSVESCVAAKCVIEGDQPHALVGQDDLHLPDLGETAAPAGFSAFICPEQPQRLLESLCFAHDEALSTPLACRHAPGGIRRHRWLCMERC